MPLAWRVDSAAAASRLGWRSRHGRHGRDGCGRTGLASSDMRQQIGGRVANAGELGAERLHVDEPLSFGANRPEDASHLLRELHDALFDDAFVLWRR
jgi:hypothetical protein